LLVRGQDLLQVHRDFLVVRYPLPDLVEKTMLPKDNPPETPIVEPDHIIPLTSRSKQWRVHIPPLHLQAPPGVIRQVLVNQAQVIIRSAQNRIAVIGISIVAQAPLPSESATEILPTHVVTLQGDSLATVLVGAFRPVKEEAWNVGSPKILAASKILESSFVPDTCGGTIKHLLYECCVSLCRRPGYL
jgi:hypothetical protein